MRDKTFSSNKREILANRIVCYGRSESRTWNM